MATVCAIAEPGRPEARGHAKDALTCAYHAWRYYLAGHLTSVAFRRGSRQGGMPYSFRLEEHGLKTLRTDTFGRAGVSAHVTECPAPSDYIGTTCVGSAGHAGKPKILGTTSQSSPTELSSRTSRTPIRHRIAYVSSCDVSGSAGVEKKKRPRVAIAERGHHAIYHLATARPTMPPRPLLQRDLTSLPGYGLKDRAFAYSVLRVATGITCRAAAASRLFVLQSEPHGSPIAVIPKGAGTNRRAVDLYPLRG